MAVFLNGFASGGRDNDTAAAMGPDTPTFNCPNCSRRSTSWPAASAASTALCSTRATSALDVGPMLAAKARRFSSTSSSTPAISRRPATSDRLVSMVDGRARMADEPTHKECIRGRCVQGITAISVNQQPRRETPSSSAMSRTTRPNQSRLHKKDDATGCIWERRVDHAPQILPPPPLPLEPQA